MTKDYIDIQCEDCGSEQDMEFSTGYGDEPLSKLHCGNCSAGWRNHMISNDANIEVSNYFTTAYCNDCGTEYDLLVTEGGSAKDVTCKECVKDKK